MEKLTISRIGEPKTINFTNKRTGAPDSFQKVGFQTNEYADRWIGFTYHGTHRLEVGKQFDFELKSREYNGKTYWDASFPKVYGAAGGGLSPEQYMKLVEMINAVNTNVLRVIGMLPKVDDGYPKGNFNPDDIDAAFASSHDIQTDS